MILMSPGVSVIAAGIVSGLCFVIINGLRRGRTNQSEKDAKSKRHIDNTRCACCLKPFIIGRGVECGECEARACRKGCSRWDTPDNAWYCLFCYQRRLWLRRNEKWIETFGGLSANHDAAAHRFSTAKSQVFLGGADYAGIGSGVGLAAGGEEDAGDSVERVREFVEKIVDSLVGDVDEIAIDRIYDHKAYDELMENYREPLAGALARLAVSLQLSISNKPAADTPTMAHAALRELVERAVEEAKKLPGLGSSDAGRSADPNDISEQTYEDLLATAILNKVIEKYQNERIEGNGNAIQETETSSRTKYITSEIEVGLDEGVEEGSSSLEPLSQDEYSSDCSAPALKYTIARQEPLSLTIEEHIEEVTTTYTSDEEERETEETNGLDFRNAHRVPFPEFGMDIIDPSQESSEETQDEATAPTHVDLVTNVESWEENWLFQKKKMQAQSEPVSMLVPNPSEDFKPLIGDRDADDTSDLSDCAAQSDEEIEEELLEAINNVVLKLPESTEANRAANEIVTVNKTQITEETRTKTELGKTTIAIGELNLAKKQAIDSLIEETNGNQVTKVLQQKENDESEDENELPKSPHIKIGFEDMLVFHLKDNRSSFSIDENEIKNPADSSTEFIDKEKLLVRLASHNDNVNGNAIHIPESITQVNSKSSIDIYGESETKNLLVDTSSTCSIREKTEHFVRTKIESNSEHTKGQELRQVTNHLNPLVDQTIAYTEKDPEAWPSRKDFEITEDVSNGNVEKDVKPARIKTELNLFLNETNANVENDVKPRQPVSREVNLSVDQVNANFKNDSKLGQRTGQSRLSIDETDGSKVDNDLQGRSYDSKPAVLESLLRAARNKAVISKDHNQFINLDDNLETKEVPRTPSSSPLRIETSVPEIGINADLSSLDEKLVPIESRVETKLSSFDEMLNSYGQRTEEVTSSFNTPDDSLNTVKTDVVEARLIFVDNADENSNVRTELHGIDQNEDGAQKEREYTEHYATATQRHLDSLTRSSKTKNINDIHESEFDHDDIPPPIPSTPPPIARLRQCRKAAALATVEIDVGQPQITDRKKVEVDVFLATPPRPGTIAEREHKKWENAAPIENNPYSEENIQKRLWQRQYSRKLSSDTSTTGEICEAPKMAGTPLQVVLGAGQPDVKRYGRDYYINDAKKSSGERARRSAMLNAGRRNSSLSQTSGSYDEDLEPQEQIQYQEEAEPMSNTVTEVKSKVTTWQNNNIESNNNGVTRGRQRVETTIYLESARDKVDGNDKIIKSIESSFKEVDNSWPGQNNDEILENVRRNSKNELNAKLNNQEDAERMSVTEARKSFVNDTQKSVNRLDLKAYGFSNEIKSNSSSITKVSEKCVVNKLDLKSLGYESELQRIQSTGNIDAKLNNEINSKPRIIKMKTKSNLAEHNVEYTKSKSSHNLVEYVEASGDFDKTKSTEIVKDDQNFSQVFEQFGGMISVKSMPNVTKIEQYSQNFDTVHGYKDEEEDLIITHLSKKREKLREEERLRREMIKASAKRQGVWKSENIVLTSEKTELASDSPAEDETDGTNMQTKSVEISTIKGIFETSSSDLNVSSAANIDEELPMPSVRKLAQTFIKAPSNKPTAQPRISKPHGNVKRDRPTTPEIQLIETPRQMHSLTARSLSREFREGLRQIPNKLNSTVSHVVTEQLTVVKDGHEVISSSTIEHNDDINVIAPGKLKNDIKFWEQLQNKS